MVSKQNFLTAYDYGMGALWAVIAARSAQEITKKFPFLEVLDGRPDWMTDARYEQIKAKNFHDIDEEPTGWLALKPEER